MLKVQIEVLQREIFNEDKQLENDGEVTEDQQRVQQMTSSVT